MKLDYQKRNNAYNENKDVLIYFKGYQFEEFTEENLEVIQPFLEYDRHKISNDNEDIFRWVINWITYIFQNPNEIGGKPRII